MILPVWCAIEPLVQGDPVIGDEILKRYFAMEAENDHFIGAARPRVSSRVSVWGAQEMTIRRMSAREQKSLRFRRT